MFETTKVVLTDNTRNLIQKMKESPILYLMFTGMIVFSIFIFGFTTYFLTVIETKLDVSLTDVYFLVFFAFLVKSALDLYNNYIKAANVSYSLSTHIKQRKTIFEIFLAVLIINLLIWFVFSTLYLISLIFFRINIAYPVEYLIFNIGIITAICLGCSICINFFSPKRYRLLPTVILIAFYLYLQSPLYVTLTMPVVVLHISWSIKNALESYQHIRRKQRIKEKSDIKKRSIIKALFYKETTVLWRDKLFFSFVFTAVITGFGSGYLYLYGDELLIPEAIRHLYGGFLPALFVYLGVFIIVVYTAVFPSLNLFLNEEKTMWIIRHIPLDDYTIIKGKTSALALCFISAIPFIPFIMIFIGINHLPFLIFFLIFSFLAGIIISLPLGVKYVGKKSDIMLLYSIAMILFTVLGLGAVLGTMIEEQFHYPILFYSIIILIEFLILFLSLKVSSGLLALKHPRSIR